MKNFIFLLLTISQVGFSQISNKVEGITIDAPCEIIYTRNLNNQNNYTCNYIKGDKLINYSIQTTNLFNQLNGLDKKGKENFHKQYLSSMKRNSEKQKEKTDFIQISNGVKSLVITSFLNYSDTKLKNTSLAFIYNNKGYIINLVSSDFNLSNVDEIIKRLKLL